MADRDLWALSSDFFQQQVRESCRRAATLAELLEAGDDLNALPAIRTLWIEAELPSQCPREWSRLWAAVKRSAYRSRVMSPRERRVLGRLSDPVTVYRGALVGGERGWSWTLQKPVALDFAARYCGLENGIDQARLCIAEVHTADIIAYFELGDEDEVIIDPLSIDWGVTRIVRIRPD